MENLKSVSFAARSCVTAWVVQSWYLPRTKQVQPCRLDVTGKGKEKERKEKGKERKRKGKGMEAERKGKRRRKEREKKGKRKRKDRKGTEKETRTEREGKGNVRKRKQSPW